MVHGLSVFAKAFGGFSSNYVIIGGTASDMILSLEGGEFRVTRDIDIVLMVENLNAEFCVAFWAFVADGGYEVYETKDGAPKYYRFMRPKNTDYPAMLELLSRVPDGIDYERPGVIVPLPVDEIVQSLSAILLNDEYYDLIRRSAQNIDGVPVVSKDALIQLKARAWIDLSNRKEAGEGVSSNDVGKHLKDVVRFYATMVEGDRCEITDEAIKVDMREFVRRIREIDPQVLRPEAVVRYLKGQTFHDIADFLTEYFQL